MGQILETLTILNNKRDATAKNEEPTSSHIAVTQTQYDEVQGMSIPFPQYGLPPGYTPPYENYVDLNQVPSQMPHITENVHVAVEQGGRTTTTQPKVLNVTLGGESKTEVVAPTAAVLDADRAKNKLEVLEERLRAIEGGGSYEFGDAVGLCLVPDVVIPPKFKVPNFEKYKGTTCPKRHLTMYCRKMAAHAHNEKVLIHCFQDSLGGVALNWYMHLEPTQISSWKDLVDAFLSSINIIWTWLRTECNYGIWQRKVQKLSKNMCRGGESWSPKLNLRYMRRK